MLTQLLGTAATVYGVLVALKALLQTRQMLARRSSRDVSAGFLASYAGGYAIWLAYGRDPGPPVRPAGGSIVGPWLSRRRSSAVPAITARG
jgi:hypothetical protein